MTKYHVNPETGRPNICNPVKTGVCKYGEDAPHFSSKEEARENVEAVMANTYATAPSTSKLKAEIQAEVNETFYAHTASAYNSLDDFFGEAFPQAELLKVVEQVDYRNEVLFDHRGEKFIATFYGGDWARYEPLQVSPAVEAKAEQVGARVGESLDSLDPRHEALMSEFTKQGVRLAHYTEKFGYSFVGISDAQSVTRPDGTRIHAFTLIPPGDSRLNDKPYPVQVDIELSENGERQNSRQMENGVVIFDERSQDGVAFIWQDGSESGGEYRFLKREGVVKPNYSEGQRIVALKGTGEKVEASYWKKG